MPGLILLLNGNLPVDSGPPTVNRRAASIPREPILRGHYRHTNVIATIGPSTESRERLGQLIVKGVDVIRLNMAHGTPEWAVSTIERI